MQKFQGVDYFNIDSLLSEEELLVRNILARKVQHRLLKVAAGEDEDADYQNVSYEGHLIVAAACREERGTSRG